MKLYCKDGVVIAWHDDGQDVPASAYGVGVAMMPFAGSMKELARLGEPPADGATDTRPYLAPELDLVAYARNCRWRAEIGGMVWNGMPIATDDSSKVKIAGARIKAQSDPNFETTWYGADGEGVVVDAALIIALSDAVLAHVDDSFTTFGLVKAGITEGSITTTAEIDAAFA